MGRSSSAVDLAVDLFRRYDRPGPRYTSYPTAVEFSSAFTEQTYRGRLAAADAQSDRPLSLYVHVPFCPERCWYCGCNVVITRKGEVVERYLTMLHREIDLLAANLPNRRTVSQYHWGGGTPTYLTTDQMEELYAKVTEHFDIDPAAEVAIEVDPRVTDPERMRTLRRLGFNRVSLGVQDFTPEVQEAIHRNQTEEETRALFDHCRELGFDSINLDLIYGLPLQTPAKFERNMETVLDFRPDRIALYSYAHLPRLKAHQKRIDPDALPEPAVKLRLFCTAREMLLAAGYVAIGMDHFALPDDELVAGIDNGALHRNFMGYTVKKGDDMFGVGLSAIGDLSGSFAQNTCKLSTYCTELEAGRFPIERGLVLDDDDRIRREVIERLMCRFVLHPGEIAERFGIDFADYFATELAELREPGGPVEEGFLDIGPERIEVIGNGRLFVRNICMVFDSHLRASTDKPQQFSRTI